MRSVGSRVNLMIRASFRTKIFLVLGQGFRARISWLARGLGYASGFVVRLRLTRLAVRGLDSWWAYVQLGSE